MSATHFSSVAVTCDDHAPFSHSVGASAYQKLRSCCINETETDFTMAFFKLAQIALPVTDMPRYYQNGLQSCRSN